MKKIVTLTAALLIAVCGFAQKANVSKAYNKVAALDAPDFPGAIELINAALQDPSTKNQEKTHYVAGYVYAQQAMYERQQAQQQNRQVDYTKVGPCIMKAYDYYNTAYTLSQQPNEKGKVAPKYNGEVKEGMINFYKSYMLVNYAAALGNNQDYANAVKAFDTHLSILDLPYVQGTKECPQIDSVYHQVQYFAAIYTQLNGKTDEAIARYEAIKDNGYEDNKVYQFLYNLYVEKHDTTNFVRILENGKQRFPEEFFYLGTLINYYISTNQIQKAADALEEAIQRDPNNPKYYSVKGNLLFDKKQFEEGLKYYNKAIEMAPQSADAWYNKGIGLKTIAFNIDQRTVTISNEKMLQEEKQKMNEKYKEAMVCFEKALELEDDNLDAMRELKSIYFRFSTNSKEYEKKYNELDQRMKMFQ